MEQNGGIQDFHARNHVVEEGEDMSKVENDRELVDFHRAAELGDANSQYRLGQAYIFGRGVPIDSKLAMSWCHKAAEQGHSRAMYKMGQVYKYGQQDDQQAATSYRRAADLGHACSQYMLAEMYANGEGVHEDFQQAYHWYRQAAEHGSSEAQYKMGLAYESGHGAPQDDRQAYAWFYVAVANGFYSVSKDRDEVAKRLPSAYLVQAQALATRYLDQYQVRKRLRGVAHA